MKPKQLLWKIKRAALRDEKFRQDSRYKRSMAFLERKGFLHSNQNFEKHYRSRLNIGDLFWAGTHVEPRILEVLPAAVARLPRCFVLDETKESELLRKIIFHLNSEDEEGPEFFNVPYEKLKVWMQLPLKDKRTKPHQDRKVMRTFRLQPKTLQKLALLKKKLGLSETAVIELLVEKT